MKIGYAFWGFLGDKKYDENLKEVSTPDGNAFYSWSIIKALQDAGHQVFSLMKDRDWFGFNYQKENLFSAWCKEERLEAYKNMKHADILNNELKRENLDVILLEWRWLINGRNNLELENKCGWQEDLKARNEILKMSKENNIPLIVFDLDYKLTEDDIKEYNVKYVIELGTKWKNSNKVKSCKVFIPFDFNCINKFKIKDENLKKELVYIGNRYERDWCIDKYIPENISCVIYGNWKESGRDSESRWNNLKFEKRLQVSEMYDAYSDSIATILLAKKEYCKMQFMTARIIEAIFYGTIPLFIDEYGQDVVVEYAGKYAELLTVKSKQDVVKVISILKKDLSLRKEIINYLRKHLRFMDCKFFVQDMLELVKEK